MTHRCAPVLAALAALGAAGCTHLPTLPEQETPMASDEMTAAPMSPEARVADARARRGDHYADLLARFIADTPQQAPGGWVFLGDSITELFPLQAAFPSRHVINRGIGGDKIDGVTERLDVSVFDLQPSRVNLMIGINNLLWLPLGQDDLYAEQYEALLDELALLVPGTRIQVQSILPVTTPYENQNERVHALNARIRWEAGLRDMEYVDLHSRLSNASGALRSSYTADGLHLNLAGYEAWLEAIIPPDEYFDVACALAPRWFETLGPTHAITATDPAHEGPYGGGRGPDELMIYTGADGHAATETNQYGIEARVVDGVVTELGGNNSAIPEGGFVVSGHGDAANWISANLPAGVSVEIADGVIRRGPLPEQELAPFERLDRLEGDFLCCLAEMLAAGQPLDEARAFQRDLQELRSGESHVTDAQVDAMRARLDAMAQ